MQTLAQLHAAIEARVQAIKSENSNWLCRLGCDNCCRQLAAIPQLTLTEWEWLKKGLSTLPADQLQAINHSLNQLAKQSSGSIICPLLDQATGACQVYLYRPVACRTYGFYVQRDKGLYCKDIEARVSEGALAEVVWGNYDLIDRHLNHLGASRALTEWFAEWINA